MKAESIQGSKSIIFVLGGGAEREEFAAQFALLYPNMEVWVSGGMPIDWSTTNMEQHEISRDRLQFLPASNTVENFTLAIRKLRQRKVNHIFLITSDYHLPRAILIGRIILRGIKITPIPVFSKWSHTPEPKHKILRDAVRAICAVVCCN